MAGLVAWERLLCRRNIQVKTQRLPRSELGRVWGKRYGGVLERTFQEEETACAKSLRQIRTKSWGSGIR